MYYDEMITITKHEYDRLIEADRWLGSLEAAGVDNWEGYSFALELHREEYGDES
jgi:hypothetical protein